MIVGEIVVKSPYESCDTSWHSMNTLSHTGVCEKTDLSDITCIEIIFSIVIIISNII